MVGFGAGGGTDVATRVIAEPLGHLLGQSIVIENKAGAGGTIAGDLVAKGPKDGYSALMISAGHTVAAVMIKSPALRRGEGLRAGRSCRQLGLRRARAEGFSCKQSAGVDRHRQERSRQAQLRHGRRRLDAAPHGGTAAPARRYRGAGGVVPHHRRSGDGIAPQGYRLCSRSGAPRRAGRWHPAI